MDPHVHSRASYDGHEPVELILAHASEIGLDGVVITDHDRIEASLRAAELAPEYGLLGIPGVEVSTADGHLIAVGVESIPEPDQPIDRTTAAIRDRGGAVIVPHPFQRSRHGVRRRKVPDADAIEVYNSMLFTGYRNRRANVYAERHRYPKVGGSDAHYLPNLGRAYTEIALTEPVDDVGGIAADRVIERIREGDTAIRGGRTPIRRSIRQYAAGAARKGLYELTARMPLFPTWPRSFVSPRG
ncbi:MAG: CehA/McbA family metallohydrolase [Halodesulfurarchaeum sp.]